MDPGPHIGTRTLLNALDCNLFWTWQRLCSLHLTSHKVALVPDTQFDPDYFLWNCRTCKILIFVRAAYTTNSHLTNNHCHNRWLFNDANFEFYEQEANASFNRLEYISVDSPYVRIIFVIVKDAYIAHKILMQIHRLLPGNCKHNSKQKEHTFVFSCEPEYISAKAVRATTNIILAIFDTSFYCLKRLDR